MPPYKRSRADLLTQLAAYHREKQRAPLRETQKLLASALDALNVFGVLEDVRAKQFSPTLCCGPAARDGLKPMPWVGAMIWHRPSGYLGYKTLTLLGGWGIQQGTDLQIMLGVRRLAFAAPFYDAEAYFKLIRRAFDLYYQDDGSPPTNAALTFIYESDKRLEQRELVLKTLQTIGAGNNQSSSQDMTW